MNQLVTENKFIEGIKQWILYGNREFLRSFQLRLEIRERNSSSNNSNQGKSIASSLSLSLVPPFQNIGFLETKWLEILKELVEHGNKNILKNVELHLIMEEKKDEETEEITSGVLDIKKEEGGNNPGAFSISKICKPLAQNTTSIIDGKTFNVATVECPLSSLMRSSAGNNENISNSGAAGAIASRIFKSLNLNAIMQAKLYEFKGPDKTYRLAIVVSNLFSSFPKFRKARHNKVYSIDRFNGKYIEI